MSRVLFLNGASSAGKTSIGKALQDVLDEPFLLLGLDTCLSTIPDRWGGGLPGPFRHRGFAYEDLPPDDGRPVLSITYGDIGWRIMSGFHRGVAEIVRAGNPVIIDEMLLDGKVRDDWLDVLGNLHPSASRRVLLVGVYCSIPELERRELTRTNRPGLSRWSADQAHLGMNYDLTVDTTQATPQQAAAVIATALYPGTAHAPGAS
jgi:chloramphenicol 3-O phosphotransferase